jgi:maintenance of morphology protein 1
LVGSRAKLQDVPKIEQLLVDRLRNFVHDRFVWPKYWSLTLPNLVPRSTTGDAGSTEDAFENNKRNEMLIVGQGNVLEENNNNSKLERSLAPPFDAGQGGLFETAPPLFPHTNQTYSRHPEPPPSLPGSLPNVEAWRSQAAATGVNRRPRSRLEQGQEKGGALESAYSSDVRHRHGSSVASSHIY